MNFLLFFHNCGLSHCQFLWNFINAWEKLLSVIPEFACCREGELAWALRWTPESEELILYQTLMKEWTAASLVSRYSDLLYVCLLSGTVKNNMCFWSCNPCKIFCGPMRSSFLFSSLIIVYKVFHHCRCLVTYYPAEVSIAAFFKPCWTGKSRDSLYKGFLQIRVGVTLLCCVWMCSLDISR